MIFVYLYNIVKMCFTYNVFFEACRPSITRLPFILLLWSFRLHNLYSYTYLLIFMSSLSHFLPIAFHWQLLSFLLPLGCKGVLEKDISVRQCSFLLNKSFFISTCTQNFPHTILLLFTIFCPFSLGVGSFSEVPNTPLPRKNDLYFPLPTIII